jgi:hypothetical protein
LTVTIQGIPESSEVPGGFDLVFGGLARTVPDEDEGKGDTLDAGRDGFVVRTELLEVEVGKAGWEEALEGRRIEDVEVALLRTEAAGAVEPGGRLDESGTRGTGATVEDVERSEVEEGCLRISVEVAGLDVVRDRVVEGVDAVVLVVRGVAACRATEEVALVRGARGARGVEEPGEARITGARDPGTGAGLFVANRTGGVREGGSAREDLEAVDIVEIRGVRVGRD